MSASPKPYDPAMDEILASIRKIIGDDETVQAASTPVNGPSSPLSSSAPSAAGAGEAAVTPAPMVATARLLDAAALRRVEAEVAQQVGATAHPAARVRLEDGVPPIRMAAIAPRAPAAGSPGESALAARPVSDPAPEARATPEPSRRRDLVSPSVDAAVSAAFERLGATMMPARERTVEDLMKEILRPMLKTWLDSNLPTIVERLVQQEIERMSRPPR